MKRIADTQISRNDDADVDAEPEVPTGFKKADDSVIATRRIRGLPRRTQTATTLTNGNGIEAPAATPRFAGFAGFGNAASNATPFSFTNPAPASTPASTSSATNSLSGNPSNAPVTPFTGSSTAASLPQSTLPPAQRTTVTPAENMKASDESDPALKHYCALRGLNISFQKAVSDAIDKDAFTDLSEIFERYKSLRRDFQKEYDDQVKLKKTETAPPPFFSSSVSNNQSSASKPSIFPQTSFSGFGAPLFNTGQKTSGPESSTTATAKASFPAFSKFGESSNSVASTNASKPSSTPPNPFALLDTSKSSTTSSSLFPLDGPEPTSLFSSPDAAKTPSLFSDASKPASGFPTLDTPKAPSLFSSDTSKSMPLFPPPDTPKALFPFASSDAPKHTPSFSSSDTSKTTSEFPSSDTSRTSSLFATSGVPKTTSTFSSSDPSKTNSTFPSSDTSKTTSSFPSFEASKATSSSSSSPFTFGASSLSAFAPTDASKSLATSSPTNKDTTKGHKNPFGTPSAFGSTSLFGSSASSTDSPFTLFGSGKKPEISFGTVGAPTAGSASASTGAFGGFGKPSGVIGNPVGFGFGGQASTPGSGTPLNAGEEKSSETPAEEDEAAKALFATTHHDEDGQGEEDEETIHQVRAKVFKLVKAEGGQSKWAAMGIGMFKVKKNKTSEARRVLLRNSSTGKIILNFNLYSGISPTSSKSHISFIGHEPDGSPASFKVKVKSEQDATDLTGVLEKESKVKDEE